jgi:hypothetical protein
MAAKVGNTALREIETLFAVGTIGGLSDGQLIERFLSGTRDEAETAFAALVDRHGAMVMGVCRRLLSDSNDADDALQATFLVLVRRAHSIARRDLLANWLYRVAYQTARVARTRAAKRRAKERQVIDVLRTRSTQEAGCGDLLVHLDVELIRLPEKLRMPRRFSEYFVIFPAGPASTRIPRSRVVAGPGAGDNLCRPRRRGGSPIWAIAGMECGRGQLRLVAGGPEAGF